LQVGGVFRCRRRVRFLDRRRGAQVDRRGDRGLAAERIVADDRPQHECAKEKRESASDHVRHRDRKFASLLARCLAERGAQLIGGHRPVLGPSLCSDFSRIEPCRGRPSRIMPYFTTAAKAPSS
jgi:hypothetical protein